MSAGYTLALDGSTYAGSVAVIGEGVVMAEQALVDVAKPGRGGRDELFMPMVSACLGEARIGARDLGRIVCGEGPGSFTSLRVAASIAKGIASGVGIPLFSVSSLLLVVAGKPAGPGTWVAVLPAMRGEMFTARFEVSVEGEIAQTGDSSIVEEASLSRLETGTVIGPGVSPDWAPHARGVVRVLARILAAGPCDLRTWEPTYGRLAEAQVKWEAAHGRALSGRG